MSLGGRDFSKGPSFCGACALGSHSSCPGTLTSTIKDVFVAHVCACEQSGHKPDKKLARRMAGYIRPDLGQAGGVLLDQLTDRVIETARIYREEIGT